MTIRLILYALITVAALVGIVAIFVGIGSQRSQRRHHVEMPEWAQLTDAEIFDDNLNAVPPMSANEQTVQHWNCLCQLTKDRVDSEVERQSAIIRGDEFARQVERRLPEI